MGDKIMEKVEMPFLDRYALWKEEAKKIAKDYEVSEEIFYVFLKMLTACPKNRGYNYLFEWAEVFDYIDLSIAEGKKDEKLFNLICKRHEK